MPTSCSALTSSPFPSFSSLPEDLQLTILSFLCPSHISSFSCTSRQFYLLCSKPALWFSLCHRRWGSRTLINSWLPQPKHHSFVRLYRSLDRWENLVGFWRRMGWCRVGGTPPLVFFEWGKSFIVGSRVSPGKEKGSYGVVKRPFLWLGVSPQGEEMSFVRERVGTSGGGELVPVTVSFVGPDHLVVEQNRGKLGADQMGSEIFWEFVKGTGCFSGGDGDMRRDREIGSCQLWRRKWDTEHFLKIEDYCPTPVRPLQGLWKGICKNMKLDFFLVTYDDAGIIACRHVGDASEPFSSYSLVFWSSNATSLRFPFPREEESIYIDRVHIYPVAVNGPNPDYEAVSRICCINSSYDLVIPDASGSSSNRHSVEGRIWEYESGTFGFGFLRDEYIIDMKHVALNGCLLDTI